MQSMLLPACFKPALISKGLRPGCKLIATRPDGLQASPDFKGIKTPTTVAGTTKAKLQASPDFKGIKT